MNLYPDSSPIGWETLLIEAVSTATVTEVSPEENPLIGREALEAMAGNAEVEPLEAFGTDPSVQTCEALAVGG